MHHSNDTSAAPGATQTNGTSARKAEANRANAQKCTGPTSQAGKSASSRNATRHSMLASTSTLLAQPNQELELLLNNYRLDLRPTDSHEDFLVRELAVADWRVKHISRIEQGIMLYMMESTRSHIVAADQAAYWNSTHPPACPNCGKAPMTGPREDGPEPPLLADAGPDMQTVIMGAAWVTNSEAFALLHRYQTQARRDYYRALKQLEQVRTGKAGYLPKDEAETKPEKNETKPPAESPEAAAASATAAANQTKPVVSTWDTTPLYAQVPGYAEMLGLSLKTFHNNDEGDRNSAKRSC